MKTPALKIANKDLHVINWKSKLEPAFQLMQAISCRHLPVVNDSGDIVGMLSERDLERALQMKNYSVFHFVPESQVADYMTWPVEIIDESKSIADAAKLMVRRKISSVLLVKGDVAVGIVTSEDILKSLFHEDKAFIDKIKENLAAYFYSSPISSIAQALSNSGI